MHYPTVYFLIFSRCGGDLILIWHWFYTTPLSGGAGSRGKGKFQPSRGKQLSTNRKSRGRGKTVGFNELSRLISRGGGRDSSSKPAPPCYIYIYIYELLQKPPYECNVARSPLVFFCLQNYGVAEAGGSARKLKRKQISVLHGALQEAMLQAGFGPFPVRCCGNPRGKRVGTQTSNVHGITAKECGPAGHSQPPARRAAHPHHVVYSGCCSI